jgi:hypothetical protein
MEIEVILAQFAGLPGAHLAADALASSGAPPWKTEVTELVSRYPPLARYPDYLRFLARFGGAGLSFDPPRSDDYVFLEVYGFGEFAESVAADEEGYFPFAELQARYEPSVPGATAYTGCVWRVFALDVSGRRRAEVFTPVWPIPPSVERLIVPRWDSFSAWFQDVLAYRGKLPL